MMFDLELTPELLIKLDQLRVNFEVLAKLQFDSEEEEESNPWQTLPRISQIASN
jgi:hypothetical protein